MYSMPQEPTLKAALNFELAPILADMAEKEGAPLWVELIPAGQQVQGRDGRKWVNDQPDGIVANFTANHADLPIDIEHATEIKGAKGEEAPAMGWIKALEVCEGGAIWGLVEWTDAGAWRVRNKEYRYLSPVFSYRKTDRRIVRLTSAGLTNQPNLYLTALNRAQTTEDNTMPLDPIIRQALGLADDATPEQAASAISALQADLQTARNREQQPSLDKFVPRADYDQAMNRASTAEQALAERDQAETEAGIETAINAALEAGKITPASADYHKAACRQDGGLERFQQFVDAAPQVAPDSGLDKKKPAETATALNSEERQVADQLGISHADFAAAKQAEQENAQ